MYHRTPVLCPDCRVSSINIPDLATINMPTNLRDFLFLHYFFNFDSVYVKIYCIILQEVMQTVCCAFNIGQSTDFSRPQNINFVGSTYGYLALIEYTLDKLSVLSIGNLCLSDTVWLLWFRSQMCKTSFKLKFRAFLNSLLRTF